MSIGAAMARLQGVTLPVWRDREQVAPPREEGLVQISMD
jgi:hypothetical protein